jgi:hypothetical protein
LRREPVCDNLLLVLQQRGKKFMTPKSESLATMRALTLFKYGIDL